MNQYTNIFLRLEARTYGLDNKQTKKTFFCGSLHTEIY